MTDVLILEKEAEIYAARLRAECPDVVFHAATSEPEALALAGSAEVVIAMAHEVSAALVASMPHLRWIAALTTGTEHLATLNLPANVIFTSGRGIHGPQMSELAFLYMLGLLRNTRGILDNQQRHHWERRPQRLLLGKTAVLVGVGAISEELAQRCQAFGMTVIGVSSARTEARGFDRILPRERLCEAAAAADFLIALVPYSARTHHMIGAAELSAMKPSAFFINLARGNVVDEAALIAHLADGRIAGAGLDVFAREPLPTDSKLWDMPNVIATPHIGGMSDTYADQVLPLLVSNLKDFLAGRLDMLRNIVTRKTGETA
jgi:phosphoglycerate dehydrogenase-like enzyme